MITPDEVTPQEIEDFKKESAVHFFTCLGKEESLIWKNKLNDKIINQKFERRENFKKCIPVWQRTIDIINELYC